MRRRLYSLDMGRTTKREILRQIAIGICYSTIMLGFLFAI